MPAPLIVAQRIVEDLAYALDPVRNREWNLPAALRPEEEGAGLPTKNLLGWGTSVALTTEQRQMVESAGVSRNGFPAGRAQFQTNRALLSLISDHVRDAERVLKMTQESMGSPMGSFSAILYTECDLHTLLSLHVYYSILKQVTPG